MNEPLYYEDIEIGATWESGSRTMTETDVVMFASMTGDYNPLHVDHEFAKATPFGKPIAHGLLGIAWVAGLGNYAPLVQTEAFVAIREWKFVKPCFVGDTVHIFTEAVAKEERGRKRGRVLWNRKLVRSDGLVLQDGIFESLVRKRKPSKPVEDSSE